MGRCHGSSVILTNCISLSACHLSGHFKHFANCQLEKCFGTRKLEQVDNKIKRVLLQKCHSQIFKFGGRLHVPLEATLAVCVGFNLALALLIVAYIVSLRVNPDDFRWLQPKAKARPLAVVVLLLHA